MWTSPWKSFWQQVLVSGTTRKLVLRVLEHLQLQQWEFEKGYHKTQMHHFDNSFEPEMDHLQIGSGTSGQRFLIKRSKVHLLNFHFQWTIAADLNSSDYWPKSVPLSNWPKLKRKPPLKDFRLKVKSLKFSDKCGEPWRWKFWTTDEFCWTLNNSIKCIILIFVWQWWWRWQYHHVITTSLHPLHFQVEFRWTFNNSAELIRVSTSTQYSNYPVLQYKCPVSSTKYLK